MEYVAVNFKITGTDESVMQIANDLLIDAASSAGFESFETDNNNVVGYIRKDIYDPETLKAEIESIPLEGIHISYTANDIEDADWNSAWEDAGFEPISINGKLVIYDTRHTDAEQLASLDGPDVITIGIEAKQAFGTGTHQTTRMVIAEFIKNQELIKGGKLLDCGCGTGILSIAAAKLGADSVTGYDIDEWSVNNSRHNAMLNGEQDKISILHGDSGVLETMNDKFDVVAANINRNILLGDMPRFCSKMKDKAILILSGFYETDIPLLMEKAASLNLQETDRMTEDDWACLVLSHKA